MGNHDQSVELWFEGNLDYLPLYLYSPAGCSEMCVTAGGTPPPNSKTSIGRRASRWDHNKQTDKQIRNKKLERVLLQEHRRAKSEISRRCTRTTSQGRRLLPGERNQELLFINQDFLVYFKLNNLCSSTWIVNTLDVKTHFKRLSFSCPKIALNVSGHGFFCILFVYCDRHLRMFNNSGIIWDLISD